VREADTVIQIKAEQQQLTDGKETPLLNS